VTAIESSELDQSGLGLRQYLDVLRRRKWIVLAVVAVAVAAAAVLSFLQDSTYEAEMKVVVGQEGTLIQTEVLGSATQTLAATMADLLQSNVVAERVIDQLGLDTTPEKLLDDVGVSINPETAVLNVSVLDTDRGRAREIVATMGTIFQELVRERFGSQQVAEGQTRLSATIWDPAHVNPDRVAPKPIRNMAIAGVLGLLLGVLGAFLRDHFDRVLRTREAVERSFGLPVIGQIPFQRARRRDRDRRAIFWSDFGEGAESFRALRANLQYLAVKRPLRTILVTSASPEQGKTTVAANLGVAIASSGASVAVIEGDLRRPRLDDAFGVVPGAPGLTSVLVGTADPERAVMPIELSSRSDGRLSFLPSGPLPPNPTELLSSMQMRDLLDQLVVSHDYVVVDSPPMLLVADALELARVVDGVILVVRRNHASSDDARELRALVERLDIHLVGVVFTDVEPLGSYGTYGDQPRAEPPRREEPIPEPEARASGVREEF